MIFIKLVKQTQNNDCSLACLAMVINYYYNQNYDVDRLKVVWNIKQNDTLPIICFGSKTYNW
ncbi:hypothetical protein JIY74_32780 [Vibrio harveyi]|nr:hypothetical protein [Vibrio harveyi]